jgi:ribosomal protein S27AE
MFDYSKLEARIFAMITISKDVIYAKIHPAKVINILPSGEVRIKFNDPNLIPRKMNVPFDTLEWVQLDGSKTPFTNANTHCPNCDIPWKETLLARFPVYDCPKCGAKKEEYVS